MHQDWKTQNIVVTGAASGLDLAMCTRFIRLDASVRGIDINKAQLEKIKAALGENFTPVVCDVANWKQVVDIFEQFPPIDVLVNSAGIAGQTNLKSDETEVHRFSKL